MPVGKDNDLVAIPCFDEPFTGVACNSFSMILVYPPSQEQLQMKVYRDSLLKVEYLIVVVTGILGGG